MIKFLSTLSMSIEEILARFRTLALASSSCHTQHTFAKLFSLACLGVPTWLSRHATVFFNDRLRFTRMLKWAGNFMLPVLCCFVLSSARPLHWTRSECSASAGKGVIITNLTATWRRSMHKKKHKISTLSCSCKSCWVSGHSKASKAIHLEDG